MTNFISCVKWVHQGATKNVPDDVNLNEEELRELVNEIETDEKDAGKPSTASGDEYNLENYDNEEENVRASLKDIVSFDNQKKTRKKSKTKPRNDSFSDDSEKEDDIIKDDDNLILVGHVDDDFSVMNVYVYNENDGDMYIHHDLVLNSPPLCVEWLNASGSGYSNMCAIGGMKPVIEIWDLDIMNCVEPIFKLGRSKKKTSDKNFGHIDAVLSLAWNTDLSHILCSGSVDTRGLLWDLHAGKIATEITVFADKLQSLLWNPHNPYYLLTGCADGYVRNFDCRLYDQFQKFNLKSPIESTIWDVNNEYCCFVGLENGNICSLDFRMRKPLGSFEGHGKEVTGLGIDKNRSNVLISISTDESLKCWDMEGDSKLIYSRDFKLGALQCIDMNPDHSYLACIGGCQETRNKKILQVVNIKELFSSDTKKMQNTTPISYEIPLLEEGNITSEDGIKKKKERKLKSSIKLPQENFKDDKKVSKKKKLKLKSKKKFVTKSKKRGKMKNRVNFL